MYFVSAEDNTYQNEKFSHGTKRLIYESML